MGFRTFFAVTSLCLSAWTITAEEAQASSSLKYVVSVQVKAKDNVIANEMLSYLGADLRTIRDLNVDRRALHKLTVSVLRTGDSYTASAVEVLSTTNNDVSFYLSDWIFTAPTIKALAKLIETSFDIESIEQLRRMERQSAQPESGSTPAVIHNHLGI